MKQSPGNGEGKAGLLCDIDEASDCENDMDVEEGLNSVDELDDALKDLETVMGRVEEVVANLSTRFVAYQDRQVELLDRVLAATERRPYLPANSQKTAPDGKAVWSGGGLSTH